MIAGLNLITQQSICEVLLSEDVPTWSTYHLVTKFKHYNVNVLFKVTDIIWSGIWIFKNVPTHVKLCTVFSGL